MNLADMKWDAAKGCVEAVIVYDGLDYPAERVEFGWLFRPSSLWIGAHYSRQSRRWCINFVPMVTLWICLKGGRRP